MTEPQPTGRARLEASLVFGRHDILFHRDHQAVEQVTGALPLGPEDLAAWTQSIEARVRWCAERGIVFRFLVAPEKHVVYADKLPPTIAISESRPARQILAALSPEARARCLYPVEPLVKSRARFPTYFRNDTHWTQRGAFLAYLDTMASLRREIDFESITWDDLREESARHLGDLGVRLEPERDEVTTTLWLKEWWPFRRIFENHGRARGSTIVFESDRTSAPRLLVFRDSFFNYFLPHIVPVFSKSVIVSSIDMHFDVAEALKPDIVLFEVAERFLGYLTETGRAATPADRTDLAFEDFSGVSLDRLKD